MFTNYIHDGEKAANLQKAEITINVLTREYFNAGGSSSWTAHWLYRKWVCEGKYNIMLPHWLSSIIRI